MATLDQLLLDRIHVATDQVAKGCLLAELAAYTARMGNYTAASNLIRELRSEANLSSPSVSAWIMFAEGLVLLQDELNPLALDRMVRGFSIADSVRATEISAQIASWIAHISYNQNRYAEMSRWAGRCISRLSAQQHGTRARICLMFADAHRYAGLFKNSNIWYQTARMHSTAIGDEAFLASLMYNRAAYGISRIRFESISGDCDSSTASQLMIEIDSALNYSAGTANTSARFLQGMWKGRLLMLLKRHAEAEPLLRSALENMPEARHLRLRVSLQSDLMVCDASMGRTEQAKVWFNQIIGQDLLCLTGDDRAFALNQMATISKDLELGTVGIDLSGLLNKAQFTHVEEIEDLRANLANCNDYVDVP